MNLHVYVVDSYEYLVAQTLSYTEIHKSFAAEAHREFREEQSTVESECSGRL